jgi:regulator of nucleoside diphosphate kinase
VVYSHKEKEMKYGKIIVEKKEFATVKGLLMQIEPKADSIHAASVAKLANELKEAQTVDDTQIPEDVIRLNTTVTISTPMDKEKTFQIVSPGQSNISQNKLSILAPMGLALFGYAEGDEVQWQFPSGINKIKILKVKQSEVRTVGTKTSY